MSEKEFKTLIYTILAGTTAALLAGHIKNKYFNDGVF